jgi:hypothetical protein
MLYNSKLAFSWWYLKLWQVIITNNQVNVVPVEVKWDFKA